MSIKQSLDEVIYKELMKGFFDGSYTEGIKIDPTEVAKKYGVSKTPVTQALKRMNNEGLLSCTLGGKYHVPYCTEQEVNEICYVRALFEKEAVKALLKVQDQHVLQVLERKAIQCQEHTGNGEYIESIHDDLEWHKYLVGSMKNQFAMQIYTLARNKLLALNYVSSYRYCFQNGAAQEHLDIINALKASDETTALRLIEEHIETIRERLIAYSQNRLGS